MGLFPKNLKWGIILPVGLLAAALILIVSLDVLHGGDAEPEPLLGALGTPVRGTFVPPTATPFGGGGTPRPRPTFAGVLPGTATERDARRRTDLLVLLDATNKWKERSGSFISTNGNLQTLCAFRDVDAGCALKEILGTDVPTDPAGAGSGNGYWYESDGTTMRLFAALELDIPAADRCLTENVDLREKPSLICVRAP